VLPETNLIGAAAFAEKIRSTLEMSRLATSAGDLAVTASFGVAELAPSEEPARQSADALLREADIALYVSKSEVAIESRGDREASPDLTRGSH